MEMSYDPLHETSKLLPAATISRKLEDLAATGEDFTRFSRSPPSLPSGTTTEYEDSAPPSPGEQLRDQESRELRKSTARGQFAIQEDDELDRMRAARDRGLLQQPHIFEWQEAAEANVRYRWIQLGIWDQLWDKEHYMIWKHEWRNSSRPLQQSQVGSSIETKTPQPANQRNISDIQIQYENAERSAIEMQSRQMSRPCYQFVHQFCEERLWIRMGLSTQGPGPSDDLDATAYENVRSRWIKHGIWDDDWTTIPGVWWRHERPRKHPPVQEYRREDEAVTAARIQEAERPPEWYPMAPERPLVVVKNQTFSSRGSYKGVSDSPNPEISASSSISVPSETQIRRNVKPQTQRLPNPRAKKSAANGINGSSNVKTIQRQKGRPRKAQKPNSRASNDERPSAANKGNKHTSRPVPEKQGRVNNVASSRPRRAAAVAAVKDMANMR